MSYFRVKSRQTNSGVFLQNRLATFTSPPMRTGDLYVEKNETIGGNLDISGNLTVGGDLKAKNFYASGNYYLDNYVLIPAGTIIQSAATTIPGGWLLCNGSSLIVLEYQSLFNAIGYTYGGATTTFNIPDTRGRTTVGSGTGSALTARTLGNKGGEETHVLTTGEMPSHTHSSNANGPNPNASGEKIGLITVTGHNTQNGSVNDSATEPDLYAQPQALEINYTGSGNAHNVMQPFIVFNYLIKY